MIIEKLDNNNIPKISCIYKIINLSNNKIYIGKTINLKKRIYHHIFNCKNSKNTNTPIINAILKNDINNFICEIIEICEDKYLFEREHYYIELYKSYDKNIGYNVLRNGFDRLCIKHSDVTKKNISNTCKKNVKRGKDHYTVKQGSKNIKLAHLRNTGKSRPDWVRNKISLGNKNLNHEYSYKKVKQICKITLQPIKIWKSISDANVGLNKPKYARGIGTVCNKTPNGKGCIQKTAYGFIWEFTD